MRLPGNDEHIVIFGHNGSGKTHEAAYHLSQRNFDEIPWFILDFKGDDLIATLPVTAPFTIDMDPPDHAGLFVVPVTTQDFDDGAVSRFMLRCLERRNVGIMADEGQPFGHRNRGLHNYLTQGRTAGCPLIILSQRAINIDTYVFSECPFIQIFHLPHPDDREKILKTIPPEKITFDDLKGEGRFHSFLYYERDDEIEFLEPAPAWDEIYQRFAIRVPILEEIDPESSGPPVERRVRL